MTSPIFKSFSMHLSLATLQTKGLRLIVSQLRFGIRMTAVSLGAFYLENPYVIADAFPGVGNAGFGFELDATQAANANLLLAAFPGIC